MNTKRIQILTDAKNDLEEARKFYEKQGKNVGDYFWDSLLSDIESLVIFAGIHRKEYGFHRMLSKRFPYAIYYDVNGDVASVIAAYTKKPIVDKIENNGLKKIQAICAVMRKLLYAIHGMLKTNNEFDGSRFYALPVQAFS